MHQIFIATLNQRTFMPIHVDINEVRVFKAVYEQNGFKKAADVLFVTQDSKVNIRIV